MIINYSAALRTTQIIQVTGEKWAEGTLAAYLARTGAALTLAHGAIGLVSADGKVVEGHAFKEAPDEFDLMIVINDMIARFHTKLFLARLFG